MRKRTGMSQERHKTCDREHQEGKGCNHGRKGMGRPVVDWHDITDNQQDIGK